MQAEWQAKVYRKPKRIGGENRGPITLQLEITGAKSRSLLGARANGQTVHCGFLRKRCLSGVGTGKQNAVTTESFRPFSGDS